MLAYDDSLAADTSGFMKVLPQRSFLATMAFQLLSNSFLVSTCLCGLPWKVTWYQGWAYLQPLAHVCFTKTSKMILPVQQGQCHGPI